MWFYNYFTSIYGNMNNCYNKKIVWCIKYIQKIMKYELMYYKK